jgi:integrase/recombinase XerD
VTPLRQRFCDDLRLRNYAPRTIDAYVAGVVRFAKHFGRSPDQLGAEDVRSFQLELLRRRVSWSLFNQTVCALRFFYHVTLQRPDVVKMIPFGKKPKTLPCVLSPEEVLRFIDAAWLSRDRTLLRTAYACGLRIGELLHLRVGDIDSARMVVVVRQGKGGKDRLVPLSPRLLEELRDYWRQYRPKDWLFPGGIPGQPLTGSCVQRLCQRLVVRAGLAKKATPHTLRHSFATHMLEAGVDLLTLKTILGHSDLDTTAHYLHIGARRLQQLPSLLDRLMLPTTHPAADTARLATEDRS